MATESGSGEGQALAQRLLEALDADRPPDWDAFHGTYSSWLTYVAAGCLARNHRLRSKFKSPGEVVNAFLAEKVFPLRQARLMLSEPARGVPIASPSGCKFAELLRRCATVPHSG